MKRIEAMRAIQDIVGDDLVICNEGGNINDWHELRPYNNFYMPHSMGMTTALALGLALAQAAERIWAFEGDGGMLMSLGMFAVIARKSPPNLKTIIFDNEDYEGGGPYPTMTRGTVDLEVVARGSGLRPQPTARDIEGFRNAVKAIAEEDATGLVVAKVEIGIDGKPMTIEAVESKLLFVRDVERKLGLELIHPPEFYSTSG